MKDERREKINTFKQQIKDLNEKRLDKIKLLIESESDDQKTELRQSIRELSVEKDNLERELALVRMNKFNSAFFKWIPSRTNRRATRQNRRNK
jgi:hypothetical protein